MNRYLVFIVLSLCLSFPAIAQQRFAPVNPNAIPEAKALLDSLYRSVAQGKIISGLHHNQLQLPAYWRDLDRIEEASGKEPLIWGGDLRGMRVR